MGSWLDKFPVSGNLETLGLGALVAVLVVRAIFFRPAQGRNRTEKSLELIGKVAIVTGMVGWLLMWFTEEAIWSSATLTCAALASIELKGQTYRSCSYLVHRYEAGEWLFWVGWAVLALSFALDSWIRRDAER